MQTALEKIASFAVHTDYENVNFQRFSTPYPEVA